MNYPMMTILPRVTNFPSRCYRVNSIISETLTEFCLEHHIYCENAKITIDITENNNILYTLVDFNILLFEKFWGRWASTV